MRLVDGSIMILGPFLLTVQQFVVVSLTSGVTGGMVAGGYNNAQATDNPTCVTLTRAADR